MTDGVPRIVITTTRFEAAAGAMLAAAGARLRTIDQQVSPEAVAALLRECDPHAVISRSVALTAAAIAAAPSLRVIAKTGVGVDNIDIAAATTRGIPVLSNVGGNAVSVAEHALALMLALARNIPRHDAAMRAGRWSRFHVQGQELRGKRLGLVGFGNSARHLAGIATAIGMAVRVYAPRYRQGGPPPGMRLAESLMALLAEADIVSLHCPLTDETRGMIDGAALAAMPRGAWIINVARGAVIVEDALVAALRSQHLGGAGLDVHVQEPMPPTHALFAMDNVVLTPHVAGSTVQATGRAHVQVARNVLACLQGLPVDPGMVVNHADLARRAAAGAA
jgi:D-3-phosphoglycerate dehydrogenase